MMSSRHTGSLDVKGMKPFLIRAGHRRWFALAGALACLSAAWPASLAQSPPARIYGEPYRPQFHFTPPRNWMNDPNGMVFYEGEYHLFYQFNPFGDRWGHMSWGHAVSPDMVHWEHLPLALPEENGVMIFSGSAVVDRKNSSGFGKEGRAPLVAIYTGTGPGSGGLQYQCLAFSNDKGRTWTKYSGNPVLNISSKEFRDPKVQWHEPSQRWIMTVSLSTEHIVCFYGSPNLKDWTLLSKFGPAGASSGLWECPDLFELPVEGSAEKRWVLVVNINPGSVAGGSGGQYFIGQFDGTRFVPERDATAPALWLDYGADYYAAVSWSDIPASDGRRLWLGWMSNWDYAQDVPTHPWRSAMSIPREVKLRKLSGGIRLVQTPVREMEKLRARHFRFGGGSVAEANEWIKTQGIESASTEWVVELGADAGVQGLRLFKNGDEAIVVGLDRPRRRVFVDRTRAGQVGFHSKFPAVHEAPWSADNQPLKFHLFIDACSVEVFLNDGETVFTELVFPSPGSRGVELFSSEPNTRIRPVEAWTLKSAWR